MPAANRVPSENSLKAGEAAAQLGVGVQTLHFYERERLIPAPPRNKAGYRLYPPPLMERLRFIRRAQSVGLALDEIRETLELAEIGESPCGRVEAALIARLDEVDRRLEDLTHFRRQLADLVANAPFMEGGSKGAQVCSIVESIQPYAAAKSPDRLRRRKRT